MDSVYVIAGTVLLGLVGAAVFFLTQQPAQATSQTLMRAGYCYSGPPSFN